MNRMITVTIEGMSVFRRSASVVARRVGEESILVPVRDNVGDLDFVYTLSPVAARIWAMLDGIATVDSIGGVICAEYEVERDEAVADVAGFLADMTDVSLVTRVS